MSQCKPGAGGGGRREREGGGETERESCLLTGRLSTRKPKAVNQSRLSGCLMWSPSRCNFCDTADRDMSGNR